MPGPKSAGAYHMTDLAPEVVEFGDETTSVTTLLDELREKLHEASHAGEVAAAKAGGLHRVARGRSDSTQKLRAVITRISQHPAPKDPP